MTPELDRFTGWHKSSYSETGSNQCVEIGYADNGDVALRDTKDRSKPAHIFDAGEWSAFKTGVKNDEF